MIWKIFLGYLIGFMVTIVIRLIDVKIEMIKIKSIESKEEILIFSLLWLPGWILLFIFLGMEEIKKRKAKKAIRAEK